MAEHGIYRIRNLNNQKCYIGSAAGQKGLRGRWNEHRRRANTQRHHSIVFQRAWNKYGADAFVFEILFYCNPEDCLTFEQIALDCYQPTYNICQTAGSTLGMRWKLSEETRKKMSKSFRGRRHSDKSKHKMSINSIGKTSGAKNGRAKLSQGDIKNIRDTFTGEYGQLSKLARNYNVHPTTIQRIVRGELWSKN